MHLECAQLGYMPEIKRGQKFFMGHKLGYTCFLRDLGRSWELNKNPSCFLIFIKVQHGCLVPLGVSWLVLSSSVKRLITKLKQNKRAISCPTQFHWILPTLAGLFFSFLLLFSSLVIWWLSLMLCLDSFVFLVCVDFWFAVTMRF